jgi:hypothetical protein
VKHEVAGKKATSNRSATRRRLQSGHFTERLQCSVVWSWEDRYFLRGLNQSVDAAHDRLPYLPCAR